MRGRHSRCLWGPNQKISSVTTSAEKRQGLYHTLGRLGGVDTGKLVQHPVVGGIEPLQMLLLTSGHDLFGPFQSETIDFEELLKMVEFSGAGV